VSNPDSSRRSTVALLALAALVRIAAAWHWSDNLDDDRDVYRAIALGIVEGRGFSSPGSTVPTAYRPPLYPLLLVVTGGAQSTLSVAAINVLFGTATVGFVLAAARLLQLTRRAAWLAGLLTAIDPLLVYYTSFPMTETLCTALLTAFLWTVLRTLNASGFAQLRWSAAAGLLLGLTALCRPTVWACAALLLAAWAIFSLRPRPPLAASRLPSAATIFALLCAAVLTVAPWGLRNAKTFGRPIITTTHGGYTILLGNNPNYYREVVDQPLGVVWDGSHGPGQSAWAAELNQTMIDAGLFGEVERDQWMSREAWRTIASEPRLFARACLRRFLHFWSLKPSVRFDGSSPAFIERAAATYYVLVFTFAAGGLAAFALGRAPRTLWAAPILLIAGFLGVHLVYWTDARMRAPITPELALLAALGVESFCFAVTRRGARSASIAPDATNR